MFENNHINVFVRLTVQKYNIFSIANKKSFIFAKILSNNFKFKKMIQRIQTLFMFLSAILGGLLFAFDLASFDYGDVMMNLSVFGVDNQVDATYFGGAYTWPLISLAILMTILPVVTSFLYKKREVQVKLCQLEMLFNVIFVVLVFLYYVSNVQETINAEIVIYRIGIYFPLASLIFSLLAIRGVKKDIELLKSVDRIR